MQMRFKIHFCGSEGRKNKKIQKKIKGEKGKSQVKLMKNKIKKWKKEKEKGRKWKVKK